MKAVLVFLLAPWLAFFLPWVIPAWQGQRRLAAILFVVWAVGLLCTVLLWSGVGLGLFVLAGAYAVFTTKIPV